MPLYDYQCKACRAVTEVRHGFREVHSGACPSCGANDWARVFNPAPILFKGSGFYVTDSRKSSGGGESSSGGDSKTGGETKTGGESKPAGETKPAGEAKKSESSAA